MYTDCIDVDNPEDENLVVTYVKQLGADCPPDLLQRVADVAGLSPADILPDYAGIEGRKCFGLTCHGCGKDPMGAATKTTWFACNNLYNDRAICSRILCRDCHAKGVASSPPRRRRRGGPPGGRHRDGEDAILLTRFHQDPVQGKAVFQKPRVLIHEQYF